MAGFDGINIEPIQRRGSVMMTGITGVGGADQNDRRSSLLATTNLLASFVQQNEAAQALLKQELENSGSLGPA